jgi:hypothetical protein
LLPSQDSSRAALALAAPLMIVTHLYGGCAHAAAFGVLQGQTLEEAWRVKLGIVWRTGARVSTRRSV